MDNNVNNVILIVNNVHNIHVINVKKVIIQKNNYVKNVWINVKIVIHKQFVINVL